jgi:dienelactone hydrolase
MHVTEKISEAVVRITAGPATLEGNLSVPENAGGIVLFAHGAGSSRLSPRNHFVARVLNGAGLSTLLFDLLTPEEEAIEPVRNLRFNINVLAERLVAATDWVRRQPNLSPMHVGYFGASTGAAAALVASVERAELVRAVVSRGGRPDLAGQALARVRAPTLLIVGGEDPIVIQLNEAALAQLRTEKRLVIIPGATHLFEEPGALDEVARLARDWFELYLLHSESRMPGPQEP